MYKNLENTVSMGWDLTKESARESALNKQKQLNWHQHKDNDYLIIVTCRTKSKWGLKGLDYIMYWLYDLITQI